MTVLCEQPHYFQKAVFITPNSTSMRQQLPVPTPPCPGEPSDVPCLWEGAYSRHGVETERLCPSYCTSFTWRDVFQVSPRCSRCQHFIPFYVYLIFQCTHKTPFCFIHLFGEVFQNVNNVSQSLIVYNLDIYRMVQISGFF